MFRPLAYLKKLHLNDTLDSHALVLLFIPALLMAVFAIVLNISASIRLDEAQSLWAATKSVPGILEYIAQDVHVPLYLLTLHFWTQIFGTSIVAMRSLSVIFFAASVPALYVLSQEAGGKKIARVATSLYCLSPFLTWYSTETRMYSMLTFLSIMSHITFFRVLRSDARSGLFWFVLVSVIGMYTHYFFAIILFLQGLFYLLHSLQRQLKKWHNRDMPAVKGKAKPALSLTEKIRFFIPAGFVKFIVALVVIGLSFLPWVIFVVSQGPASNNYPLLSSPTSYNLLQLFVHFFTGFQSANVQNGIISIWPIAVILLFFTFSQKLRMKIHHTDYFFILTFAPIAIAYLVSYTLQPILVSRYLIFITPTLFYLLAVLLSHFNRSLFLVILGIVFLSNVIFQYQQTNSTQIAERENYSEVADYLTAQTKESDIIVVSAPFTVYPIEYEYDGRAKIDTIPKWNRFVSGSIPPFNEIDLAAQTDAYDRRYRRMFVILSYDQGYEEQVKQYLAGKYELLNSYTFSPGLEMFEYRLPIDYKIEFERQRDADYRLQAQAAAATAAAKLQLKP